jgi:crotonobetainyl-CoA:carnitine CoA-transferase CaiB-like acyl-CoA transferase
METSLTAQSAMFQSGELTTWPGAPAAPKGCRDCLGIAALDRYYLCADGWIAVACSGEAEAAALAGALGHPDWAQRFDMLGEPRDGALAGELAATLGAMPAAEALNALVGAGVRACPVREGEEILASSPTRGCGPTTSSTSRARPRTARSSTAPTPASRAARAATNVPTPASANTPSRSSPTTASPPTASPSWPTTAW